MEFSSRPRHDLKTRSVRDFLGHKSSRFEGCCNVSDESCRVAMDLWEYCGCSSCDDGDKMAGPLSLGSSSAPCHAFERDIHKHEKEKYY